MISKLKNIGLPDDAVRQCNQLNANLYLPTDDDFLRRTFKYNFDITIPPTILPIIIFSIIWAVEGPNLGFKGLFTGVKWDGHDWVHLETGQPASADNFRWCNGNPQGKTTLFFYCNPILRSVNNSVMLTKQTVDGSPSWRIFQNTVMVDQCICIKPKQ